MTFKYIFYCASAFLIQSIACQNPVSSCCNSISISNNGGPLGITSFGPISPSGITVTTGLGLNGNLDVSGSVPYLSAVAFEGQFDTSGTVPVSYGCGDSVAITQELSNVRSLGSNSGSLSGQGCA